MFYCMFYFTCDRSFRPPVFFKQEQQRVAVGPGNARFISVRQVSSDAGTLWRCTCGPPLLLLLLLLLVVCIANLLIKS